MKVATKDLAGHALGYATALANGVKSHNILFNHKEPGQGRKEGIWLNASPFPKIWRPWKVWDAGGPIIEREKIELRYGDSNTTDWIADTSWHRTVNDEWDGDHEMHGPTPLIAAMRCFVASKLGDEVDVPQELLS